jgi:hypothetical protein
MDVSRKIDIHATEVNIHIEKGLVHLNMGT